MSKRSKRKSHKSKAFKEKGIIMSLRMPKHVAIAIPKKKRGNTAPIEFDITFKNNTSSDSPFKNFVPQLVAPDGQMLKRKEPETPRQNWGLITRGLPVGFTLKGRIYWLNNSLTLSIPNFRHSQEAPAITLENSWTFDGMQPGIYKLSFVCEVPNTKILSLNVETSELSEIHITNLSTNEVNFHLLEPLESNQAVVEVDGISFETIISEPIFNIPKKEPGAKARLNLAGIRITNNTPNPVHFSFYVTVIPEIVKADGQVLFRGYFSDWSREAIESDIVLVMPGENVTFFPWSAIWWQENDQFEFVIEARDGGYYTFQFTDLGSYQIKLNYVNNMEMLKVYDEETGNIRQIENIWTGMIITPFVEFQLKRP